MESDYSRSLDSKLLGTAGLDKLGKGTSSTNRAATFGSIFDKLRMVWLDSYSHLIDQIANSKRPA